jgi:hypothetical protein
VLRVEYLADDSSGLKLRKARHAASHQACANEENTEPPLTFWESCRHWPIVICSLDSLNEPLGHRNLRNLFHVGPPFGFSVDRCFSGTSIAGELRIALRIHRQRKNVRSGHRTS